MNFSFIGWCKEENHDKVWGAIELGTARYVTFWGRRGKKLQTKSLGVSSYELRKLINQKTAKGYISVDKNNLDRVYPEFEKDLEQTAMWSMLKGTI
jgi:predicted DNA-binding WGR domain protein